MVRHTIVWLDAHSSDLTSSFRDKLGDAQLFTDANDCIKYIKSQSDTSIYFIVSGSLARQVVPDVYDCVNLIKIFLFCGSVIAHAGWAMSYCEKLMIFDHGDDLLQRLCNDLESALREQATQYLKCADKYKQRALQYRQAACG